MFWIPNQLEGAYVGQDVTLECHSEAFPPSINYWEKEDGHTLVSGWYLEVSATSIKLIQFVSNPKMMPISLSHTLALFLGKKYETHTRVSGYKVYMQLRIRNVGKIDFMQYKCIAKNALGYSDGSITLYGKIWQCCQLLNTALQL